MSNPQIRRHAVAVRATLSREGAEPLTPKTAKLPEYVRSWIALELLRLPNVVDVEVTDLLNIEIYRPRGSMTHKDVALLEAGVTAVLQSAARADYLEPLCTHKQVEQLKVAFSFK